MIFKYNQNKIMKDIFKYLFDIVDVLTYKYIPNELVQKVSFLLMKM